MESLTSKIANSKILVIGDVILDKYLKGDSERISPEAPVPVVKIRNKEIRLGGAANVAFNVVSLGAEVFLYGAIGNDTEGKELRHLLRKYGINDRLRAVSSWPTIVKTRVIARNQQMLRTDFEEPLDEGSLELILEDYKLNLGYFDAIILSDYGKGVLRNAHEMILLAKKLNKFVLVDPKGDDYHKYQQASVITPNKTELKAVVGDWKTEDELIHKAEKLRKELKLPNLLLTRSEEGMTLFNADGIKNFKTEAKEVYDVSGAGDTVIAVLAVMLTVGFSWSESISLANKAGGIVVGKFGTATISRQELFPSQTLEQSQGLL